MSTPAFVPAYRPTQGKSALFHKHSDSTLKRKRSLRDDQSSESSGSSDSEALASVRHPINSKDPYHVAGQPREQNLPAYPFPFKAVKSKKHEFNLERELASVKPPILTLAGQDSNRTSLKHRHLDNLAVILHSLILKRDWPRASRVFGLLVRTDLAEGVDLRRGHRWALAGETLLHRDAQSSDGGLQLDCSSARAFYEKMILNYPHSASGKITETAIYPALFNVWIYEVQDQSKHALRQAESDDASSSEVFDARRKELDGAREIAARMDSITASPPYDKDLDILRLRANVAMWIADLCKMLLDAAPAPDDAEADSDLDIDRPRMSEEDTDELMARIESERALSTRLFARLDP